jgi:hypothetical protein
MRRYLKKGTIFRDKKTGALWKVIGVTPRFNSGMGGASYHLCCVAKPTRQISILWVDAAYGHPEWELANGLEIAVSRLK